MSKKNNPTKIGWAYAGGIVFILVVVVIAVFAARKPADPVLPTIVEIEEIVDFPLFPANYDFILTDEWDHAKKAQEILNESQGKEAGQEVILSGVVQDVNIKEIYYFATVDRTSNAESFLGIYSYDIETFNWERIYKETLTREEPGDFLYHYRVLGMDDNRLIIRREGQDFSPGPCYDLLLATTETTMVRGEETSIISPLYAMSLQNPYGSWSEHELPEDIRTEREKDLESCYEEFDL